MNIDPLQAFFSGIGVSLIGALVANVLSRQRERHRVVEERRFEIYIKLLDLYGGYFWFTTAELHNESVDANVASRCHTLACQIADMLRSADEVDFLDDILDVTQGPAFKTAAERYKAMGQLLDRLGQKVNPRYSKKIREISDANGRLMASGECSNAPGANEFLSGAIRKR